MQCIKNVIITSYFIIFLSLISVLYKFHPIPMKLLRVVLIFTKNFLNNLLFVNPFPGKVKIVCLIFRFRRFII